MQNFALFAGFLRWDYSTTEFRQGLTRISLSMAYRAVQTANL